ncbi:MAG: hypothetical protein RBS35_00790 [Azonexus sp.]|nr:hypothetical protein [Azonexus sp.]
MLRSVVRRFQVGLIGVLILSAGNAHAQRTVDTIIPLLIEAIRLGDSQGILAGDSAALMATLFDAHTPIIVTIKKTGVQPKELPEGCARLEVTTTQDQVVIPKDSAQPGEPQFEPPADQRMHYQINFCENGRLPEDGGGLL